MRLGDGQSWPTRLLGQTVTFGPNRSVGSALPTKEAAEHAGHGEGLEGPDVCFEEVLR